MAAWVATQDVDAGAQRAHCRCRHRDGPPTTVAAASRRVRRELALCALKKGEKGGEKRRKKKREICWRVAFG